MPVCPWARCHGSTSMKIGHCHAWGVGWGGAGCGRWGAGLCAENTRCHAAAAGEEKGMLWRCQWQATLELQSGAHAMPRSIVYVQVCGALAQSRTGGSAPRYARCRWLPRQPGEGRALHYYAPQTAKVVAAAACRRATNIIRHSQVMVTGGGDGRDNCGGQCRAGRCHVASLAVVIGVTVRR